MRDLDLIERVKAGRPGAFEELYWSWVDRVHRQLFAIVGPDPELDDLVQLAFVQVHDTIGSYRGEAAFGTWLHRLTVNVAMMHLRRKRRWLRLESDEGAALLAPSAPDRPDEAVGRAERVALLHQVIGRLAPRKRVVFVLYHVEGHTLEEIAGLVDASPNTVASRLRAARAEVRRALQRVHRRRAKVAS